MKYFYDSYAIIELLEENPNIKKYFEKEEGITIKMCLLEVYYHLIKIENKEKAKQWYYSFLNIVVEPSDDEIIQSAENRLTINSKISGRKISYIDALGYTIAKNRGLKFLTCDSGLTNYEKIEKEKNSNFKQIVIDLGEK